MNLFSHFLAPRSPLQASAALTTLFVFALTVGGCASSSVIEPPTDYQTWEVQLQGYMQSCTETLTPTIYIREAKHWRKAITSLPVQGHFFLDGVYTESTACEMTCKPIPTPLVIPFLEYRDDGQKATPDKAGPKVPALLTKEIVQNLRFEFSYYTDAQCTDKKFYVQSVS